MRRIGSVLALGLLAVLGPAFASPPPGAPNCPTFPADNVWRADVSALPVHARSPAWLSSMSASTKRLHPDFGPSFGEQPVPYGIPITVVSSATAKTSVTFEYADESDAGPYPFTSSTAIEGGPDADGDRHAIIVESDTCRLYELFAARYAPNGGSTAGSGAIFDLRSNALRPDTWTSADAAGLPIYAGLLRLDEVTSGRVDHAVRFTAARTDRSYLWPARHQAGAAADPNLPPMGARFRLKSSYSLSGLRADTQVVLTAFKRYGLFLADNGSDWFFQGDAQEAWPTDLLDELKAVPASAFEAIDESSLMVSANSAQVRGASPSASPTPTPTATRTGLRPVVPPRRIRPSGSPAPSRTASMTPSSSTSAAPPWLLFVGAVLVASVASASMGAWALRRNRS